MLTRLEREEFIDAASQSSKQGDSKAMTGQAARDWMAAQGG